MAYDHQRQNLGLIELVLTQGICDSRSSLEVDS